MKAPDNFVVDFIAHGESPDEWRMVLVEQGPWAPPHDDQLRRLQTRLYDCIDAAVDGLLAEKFPQSRGGRLVIQVDGYSLPGKELSEFFERFSSGALNALPYRRVVESNPFVSSIRFELNLDPGKSTALR
jgi:hypothetical protein